MEGHDTSVGTKYRYRLGVGQREVNADVKKCFSRTVMKIKAFTGVDGREKRIGRVKQ